MAVESKEFKTYYNEIIKELEEALKKFGSYTFFDKGPNEVMDLGIFEKVYKQLHIIEFRQLLIKISEYKEFGGKLISSVLVGLQDIPDEDFDYLMES